MSNEDDPILRDYARIAGERPAEEITRSLLSEYEINAQAMGDEDAERRWEEQEDTAQAKTKADFEHIYNPDGTCHAEGCGAPGLILACDDFSPEIAQWFCGMHWNDCTAKEMLTVAEDRRRSMASLFGGTYTVRESSPGVFTHTWGMSQSTLNQDVVIDHIAFTWTPYGKHLVDTLVTGTISKRAWRIYEKAIARRARLHRQHQRDRARTRRQHLAAFRRRKAGLA